MLELIVTLGAAVAVVWGFLKWVRPIVKTGIHILVAFHNTVIGTDEVTHPDTGQVIVPAQPGIGSRMATLEVAVTELVTNNRRLDDHERRIARLEEARDA